ncbi:MAG: Ni-sirohydrochlorin a,c-diamide synthase [Methanomicrobiales archaeon]|nr:Ni-sirohydrochlorin a,c-diamide synthase [Methanomicrobiales archaeon]
MKALLISGDRSGSGKTSITLAIAVLLSRRHAVQTFKVGMDYIDPSYLTGVSGRPCRNLDGFVMDGRQIGMVYEHGVRGADFALVEGVRGLFEGADALTDRGSTAEIAKLLDLPVVLVVNARSITRSAAAVVRGFQEFDPAIRIAGVILNNIGGEGHRQKATRAIEHHCGIPVVGAVPHHAGIGLAMRHLGLVPFVEGHGRSEFDGRIRALTETVAAHVDIDLLEDLAVEREPPETPADSPFDASPGTDVRIGVALDAAFNFYYADLFDLLRAWGAETVPFSPMHGRLPDADGYILGGGYPEMFGRELESNAAMREAIREVSRNGTPVYAECGGLMYLTDEIRTEKGWQGRSEEAVCEMCGVFSGSTRIPARRIVSYVEGEALPGSPLGSGTFRGHEFHYSDVALDAGTRYVFRLTRGVGISGGRDGALVDRTLASYLHLHPLASRGLLERFVAACR